MALPRKSTPLGPAFEFNWGAIPRVQLHAILALGSGRAIEQSGVSSRGAGPTEFGLTDMELGAKIAYYQGDEVHPPDRHLHDVRDAHRQLFDKGLGVGKVWYKLPFWLQKNIGKWLLDGGAVTRSFRKPGTGTFRTEDFF